ncbi:hypothetical protein GCM10007868_20070 [Gluconobacter frateurii]|uniref:Transposase n=1 Tax=Gluconobacter frateurii NRIC 0228 TaxID=1307946 RepID=A0ABQ0Q8F2_9PROT|nr:hypothetical protein AA0228_0499 [Gluconobacter frateurii NRIC 0228]GLP90932.1 hypothetical protein GCM10007868_20070 [Gluconobacter frateurii]
MLQGGHDERENGAIKPVEAVSCTAEKQEPVVEAGEWETLQSVCNGHVFLSRNDVSVEAQFCPVTLHAPEYSRRQGNTDEPR